jgi:uncharacterized protein (DUF1778 family)
MSDILPRMGRKPSGKPHRKPIQVKLSENERDTIDAAAGAAGMETSTWMRAVCIGFATGEIYTAKRKAKR